MRYIIDLIGRKFGRLTVIKRDNRRQGKLRWTCLCKCGTIIHTRGDGLREGRSKSCGCLHKEIVSKSSFKHGLTRTRFYQIFKDMKARCNNKTLKCYKNYGGRGIKSEWESFEEFKHDMYKSYLEHMKQFSRKIDTTLDRVDNNGNYNKENCKWSTWIEQNRNKRTNKLNWDKVNEIRKDFIPKNKMKQYSEMGKKYGVHWSMISKVIKKKIWVSSTQ